VAAQVLLAQTPTAEMTGRITDPSAAVIVGAQVTIKNTDTGIRRDTTTNELGSYTVPLLNPGNYEMTTTKEGFRPISRSGLSLHVGQVARIDFVMEIGSVNETVEIKGEAPLLDSETSSLGSIIQNRQIVNMPLNSRNSVALAVLVPGIVPGPTFNSQSLNDVRGPTNILISGGRANTSEILTDGTSGTTPEANLTLSLGVLPQIDAVQEFKVQTNNLSAEFGRTGGGVLNFIFKSGTNQLHGSAFEFLRNSAMDANNFFSNRQGIPLGAFRRNQFGGTVGGPVMIPRVIDGRDKLFFFVGFEGNRQSTQSTSTLTFPTIAERTGDFSKTSRLVGGVCQPVTIFDPGSIRSAPGGGFIRTQFPNNIMPKSAIDPVGANAAAFYPLPTGPGDACSGTNNFTASAAAIGTANQPSIRIDYYAGPKDRFFARISRNTSAPIGADVYKSIATTTGTGSRVGPWFGDNGTASYMHTFTPSLIGELRFGLARYGYYQPSAAGDNFDMRPVLGWTGAAGNFVSQMTLPQGFPQIAATGYGALGTGQQPFSDAGASSYNTAGSLTKIKGAHNLKMGGEFRTLQAYGPANFNASGAYAFGPNFTQGPDPNHAASTSGNGIASLLAGLGTGSVQIVPRVFDSNSYFALYLQDDYHVTKKLTLNMGLRYDRETGRKDRYNHLSWFDYTVPSPLAKLVPSFPNLQGGIKFVNANGNPSSQFDTDPNNVGPRFGFAYSANSKTVVRGGYGILYQPFSGRADSSGAGYAGFSAVTSWVSSLDGVTPLNRFSNPFPSGLTQPLGAAGGLLTGVGDALGATSRDGAFDRTAKVGYIQQWNFTVQRTLPTNLVLQLSYIGSKGTRITDGAGLEYDQLPPADMALGNALLQSVPNPFYGAIQSGPLSAATTTVGQLLRPYPQYTRVWDFRPASASSIYHGFTAQLEKRFSRGMQFLIAYTNGKLIDDSSAETDDSGLANAGAHQNFYNRHADRAVSLQDVPQRFVFSYVMELPFGRGKSIGSNWNRLTDAFLGGWQLNGIVTIQSGLPLQIQNASDNSNAFAGVQRPNVNGDPNLSSDRSRQQKIASWFNTSVFSQPAPFTFGDGPRSLPSTRRDGVKNLDASLFKDISLYKEGRVKLEFRAELFNTLNRTQFAAPGSTFGAGGFGVVSAQANLPRQIQLGLKILF
jgi:Carboxypeptidase regulatory-like domain/TonB dependent receptor